MHTRIIFLLIISFLSSQEVTGQESTAPDWYIQNIREQIGTWVADNSEYKNDNNPFDAFAIEWKYGPLKNSIYGRLYGIIDGKEAGNFWEFHQYYDRLKDEVIVMQFGYNNNIGIGVLNSLSDNTLELIQDFAFSDGSQKQEKHIYVLTDSITQITTSYSWVDESWKKNRSYTWQLSTAND